MAYYTADFLEWWYNTGSGIGPTEKDDMETHAHRVAHAAWDAACLSTMKYREDETLVRCIIDDDTGRPSYDAYRVRSIRGGKVHAIQVNEWTWIKLAWGKNQTRRWAKTIDQLYRKTCREGERFDCLHRTKGAALRQAKLWQQARIERRNRYSSNDKLTGQQKPEKG